MSKRASLDTPGAASAPKEVPEAPKSKFVGVRLSKNGKNGWNAVVNQTVEGQKTRKVYGPFQTQDEAAHKYDEEATKLDRPVNFPAPGSEAKQARKESVSKFIGVFWHKPAKRWSSSITVLGKNNHLGYFPEEDLAAKAYDDRAGPLGRKVNFPETAPPPDPVLVADVNSKTGKPGAKKRKVLGLSIDDPLAAASQQVPPLAAAAAAAGVPKPPRPSPPSGQIPVPTAPTCDQATAVV